VTASTTIQSPAFLEVRENSLWGEKCRGFTRRRFLGRGWLGPNWSLFLSDRKCQAKAAIQLWPEVNAEAVIKHSVGRLSYSRYMRLFHCSWRLSADVERLKRGEPRNVLHTPA
jgi:hypothetical protein